MGRHGNLAGANVAQVKSFSRRLSRSASAITTFIVFLACLGTGQSQTMPGSVYSTPNGTTVGQMPLFPGVFPSTVPPSESIYSGSALPISVPAAAGDINPTDLGDVRGLGANLKSIQMEQIQQESLRNQERVTAGRTGKKPLTDFQQLVMATTGRVLPIFGASIFSGALPSTFAPATDIPVSPDYIIGPGDELHVQIWGQVNQRGAYIVDRTGSISLPEVGTVHVAGLRFDQVTEYLRSQFARVYRNFDLNVNMGQLRSIQVFVVGQARMPGSYSISSLSTLLNALFASGGPLPQGSLRDIQLKRGGKTVLHFDLYDLLLHGDKSSDVQLAQGDVIFIPPVGAQVAVVGSIHNPAIYELKGETTLQQVLQLAGGRTSIATNAQATVERIDNHSSRSVMEVSLQQPTGFQVQDGDVISIDAIVDRFKNAVTLRGNVANPGRYVWHQGMRISDLIPNKDALVTRRYWQRQNDLGQMQLNYEPEVERNAYGAVEPVVPPPSQETRQTQSSAAESEQNQQNAQTASTAPAQGAAPLPAANVMSPSSQTANTLPGSASTSSGGNSVGAAMTEGLHRFPARTDVALSAPDIDWSYAVIERQNPRTLTTSLLPFNLGRLVLDGDQSQNLELMPGDVVTIFSTADIRVPTSEQTRFVRLEGEFVSAGIYSVEPGETLRHLLQRAGGFTPNAYLYASEFTRESTRRVQQQRLNEYADHLETQAAAVAAAGNAAALNAADAAAATAAASAAQASIAQLRRAHPNGRIVMQLKPDSRGIDSVPDLELEDGDTFIVPRVPANVSVEGEVYSANAFLFKRGKRTVDYLKEAGGPDRQADMKHAFILRADGSVYSQQYGNIKHANIFPGDTIVIPPKLTRVSILRSLVDIATVVGQFGIGVAAINLLK